MMLSNRRGLALVLVILPEKAAVRRDGARSGMLGKRHKRFAGSHSATFCYVNPTNSTSTSQLFKSTGKSLIDTGYLN